MARDVCTVVLYELAEWEGKIKDGERFHRKKQRGNHIPHVITRAAGCLCCSTCPTECLHLIPSTDKVLARGKPGRLCKS